MRSYFLGLRAKRSSSFTSDSRHRMRRPSTFGMAIVIAFLLANVAAGETNETNIVGFVAEIQGPWVVSQTGKPQQTISLGHALLEGSTVESSGPVGHLAIATTDGRVEEVSFAGDGVCVYHLPNNQDLEGNSSLASRLTRALGRVFLRADPTYVAPISRGEEAKRSELWDAVVKLQDARIDVASVFRQKPPGDYTIYLERFDAIYPVGKSTNLPDRYTFHWDPLAPGFVSVTNVQEGVYCLNTTEVDNQSLEPGKCEAWILVTPPTAFQGLNTDFERFRQMTTHWQKKLTDRMIHKVLRAYLESLADELPQTKQP
jgi:hypothetical protein